MFGKDDIRAAGKPGIVEAIPEAHAVNSAPDDQLRPHVLTSNAAHVLATCLLCKSIHGDDRLNGSGVYLSNFVRSHSYTAS